MNRRELLISGAGLLAGAIARGAAGAPKVGCQTNGYVIRAGDFPGLLKVLDTLKSIGYTGFECNTRFVDGQFGRAAEARREIEKTGVEFIGGHYSMKQAQSGTFPQVAAGLAALGARAVVMSGSGLSPQGTFEKDAAQKKAKEMDALGKICNEHGLRLAYHNHNPEFANHNAEIEALAELTNPGLVSFLMDAGHGYLGGGNPADFMAKHSGRILGVHVKTFKGKEQVPMGEGDFGFEALAAAIKKAGWSGWIIDEEGGGTKAGNTAAVETDRKYIRRVFGV
jgi:sugar phosphate isomerase/epimerase